MKPFIKWVGGKGRAMGRLLPVLTAENFEGYFEPFLGGGAAFLSLSFAEELSGGALLGDTNPRLMLTWRQIQEAPEKVVEWLRAFESEDSAELYQDLRETFNQGLEAFKDAAGFAAAVFIYLNRACYNGLYRENKKGHFNASFAGPPQRVLRKNICLEDRILQASAALQTAVVTCSDFADVIAMAGHRDLVYADSPYHKASQQPYSAGAFSEDDHAELAGALRSAVGRGSYVVASNADTPFIRSLYSDFNIFTSRRVNSINHNTRDRASKPDLVITSF